MVLDPVTEPEADAGLAAIDGARFPAFPSLVKSLHGELLARLRDYIVEGNLAAGARVPERMLCEHFGISRTPLREALKVLASEGLIELLPNRGARVRQLGAEELVDLFDVMGGLEALAGRLACEKITPEAYAEIERLHHEMYSSYMRRDLHGYFACNQAIHDRIVQAADNEPLRTSLRQLRGAPAPCALLRQSGREPRPLGRGDARARGNSRCVAPARRQRAQRYFVQAPAKQAPRGGRAGDGASAGRCLRRVVMAVQRRSP